MFQLILSIGFIYLSIGLWMIFTPAEKINRQYGYRSRASLRSPERWRFAQKHNGKRILLAGILMLLSAAHTKVHSVVDPYCIYQSIWVT